MKMRKFAGAMIAAALILIGGGLLHGQDSDLCSSVDMKPVLSLQQINQAELIHYLSVLSGNEISASGGSPEELYDSEVRALIDAGFPPIIAEVEPDRLISRRYFASVMFQLAVDTNDEFAAKYGDLTDESDQFQALLEEEWVYAEEGRIYREEVLSVLCNKPITPEPKGALMMTNERIREGSIERPGSPF